MHSSPKILITGGGGQLAQALLAVAPKLNHSLRAFTKHDLDMTNVKCLVEIITREKPDIIIHCAAYTAVDRAEIELKAAFSVNVTATENLAQLCEQQRIPLFYLSTDYVFDGRKKNPYHETDPTMPINYYGQTKLLGEAAIINHCSRYLILRISGVFSEYGHNIFKTFYHRLKAGQPLNVVNDQYTCPTYAIDIAHTLLQIISRYSSSHAVSGIYHFCGQDIVTWYEFAQQIHELLKENENRTCSIQPITTQQFNARAKRPAYSALDCTKLFNDYHIKQPLLREMLCRVIAREHKTYDASSI